MTSGVRCTVEVRTSERKCSLRSVEPEAYPMRAGESKDCMKSLSVLPASGPHSPAETSSMHLLEMRSASAFFP